jgi:hypothetical protein
MNPNKKNQLFRLSAVLYADNNYIVSGKTTLRKIIETGLFAMERDSVSTHELIDFISDNYNLHIEEVEISDILSSKKQDSFLVSFKNDTKLLSLTEKRKTQIQAKIDEHTIEFFIDLYIQEKEIKIDPNTFKELLYRFLYDILTTNVESFKKLFDKDNSIETLINVDSHNYSLEEKEFINGFLKWDNGDKNKAVFDIASFAIEYCLVSNDSKQGLDINSLKNKVFYLDTNVIYRALGINGEDRRKRSLTFLTRFKESNTTLVISKYTDKEFKDTIDYYIKRLGNKPFKNDVNPSLFKHPYFSRLKDIYNFYYQWCLGKQNHSLELFKADIHAKYKELCKRLNIEVDYKNTLKEDDKETAETLNDYISSINTHKSSDASSNAYEGYEFDAKNILLLEILRDTKNTDIFNTKQFFLSTDQSLRRWDFSRGNKAPLVILPSQWMSLLLRYQSRTTDDFKSFVSFLNLPIPEKQISSQNIHNVLAGISEVTSNFEQQAFIVEQLVEQGFESIMQRTNDSEKLYELTIEKSESILQKKIGELEKKQDQFEGEATERIQDLEKHNKSNESIIGQKDSEIEKLKKDKYALHEQEELRKYQKPAKRYWIPLSIILITVVLLCFAFQEQDWNLVKNIIDGIDEEPSETRQWIYRIGISLLISVGIFGLIKASYSRLAKQKVEDYKDKIRSRYEDL